MILTRMGKKLVRFMQLVENPKLIKLRQQGIPIDTFCLLNQPWLLKENINTVIDIGANIGEFTALIHELLI